MAIELNGKRVVVTGGASGIGKAMAEQLRQAGARVVVADIDLAKADQVAQAIDGGIAVRCDVSDHASVEALAERVLAEFGGVDLVFANAGTILGGPLIKATPDEFDWLMGINVRGAWSTLSVFARMMLAQDEGGHLCVTGSEHSLGLQHSGVGIYSASKQAVLALADVLRAELPAKVGISVLCPGVVDTPLGDAPKPAHMRQQSERQRAVSRKVQAQGMSPDDIARAAIAGVCRGEYLIFTHPHTIRAARNRFTEIEAAFAEQAPWTEESERYDVNRIVARVLAEEAPRG